MAPGSDSLTATLQAALRQVGHWIATAPEAGDSWFADQIGECVHHLTQALRVAQALEQGDARLTIR